MSNRQSRAHTSTRKGAPQSRALVPAVVPHPDPPIPQTVHAYRSGAIAGANGATTAPSYLDKIQVRVGSSLTPQYISGVLRRADDGQMDTLADMLDEVRETDPHLHAVLFKREAQVAGAPWEIRPARRARAGKRRDKIVDFCTDVLENLPGFGQTCAHLQSAVYHGRAGAENIWRRDGARMIIERIDPVHPRRLSYAALNWKLHLWDASGGTRFSNFPGVPIDEFPKGKFVVHTPRIRGGYPTREGLGRVLVWYSVFKRWTQRDWMALAEMAGRPGRVGYYGTGSVDPAKGGMPEASPQDQQLLEDALVMWSSSVAVKLPDTVRLDFQSAVSGLHDMHKVLAEHCNSEISKGALGETLTTEAGSKGARSLGDVHDDVRLMIALWDAKCLAETIRYYILAPLVRLNFGDGAAVPEIVFNVEPSDNLNMVAERFVKLAQGGLDIDQEHVRDVFGIPEPLDGVRLMIPRAPAAVDANGEIPAPPPALDGSTEPGEGGDKGGPGAAKGKPSAGAKGGQAGGQKKPAGDKELGA
jgi:phage gp29-like protein